MNNKNEQDILVRLTDLQNQSFRHHRHVESFFLNEEELAQAKRHFPESEYVRYDGGYEGARKQKVIFCVDTEDDFSDIVCIHAHVDQRFRTLSHRDVLGSIMALQIDRHSIGDLWVEDEDVYVYTSNSMAQFLVDNLRTIANLNVSFEPLDTRPVQTYQTKPIQLVIASPRLDAIVAALAHTSRTKAKEMIRNGLVQINHVTLVEPDEVCNNNCTVSIRGIGRFTYVGIAHNTRKKRMVAEFEQFV